MTDATTEKNPLLSQLESLVKGAKEFKAEHGSCRVTVGPNAPIAKAGIERVAGFWVDVDEVTLVSVDGKDRTVVDGPLVYFRAVEHDDVTAKGIAQAVDWLGHSDEIDWSSADWSSVSKTGAVYLEGRKGSLLVDATFVLKEFSAQPDWDEGLDWDDDDE